MEVALRPEEGFIHSNVWICGCDLYRSMMPLHFFDSSGKPARIQACETNPELEGFELSYKFFVSSFAHRLLTKKKKNSCPT